MTTLGESERRERGPRCISPAELPALLSEVAPAARSSMQGWRRAEPLARGEPRCAAALYLPRPHHRLVSICVCRLRVSQNDFAHGLIVAQAVEGCRRPKAELLQFAGALLRRARPGLRRRLPFGARGI